MENYENLNEPEISKIKARENAKKHYYKIKSDPKKYEEYRRKKREQYEKRKQNPEYIKKQKEHNKKYYHEVVKANPEKYQEHLRKNREFAFKKYHKIKNNPKEWEEFKRKKKNQLIKRRQDPEYVRREKEYHRNYYLTKIKGDPEKTKNLKEE